MESLFIKRGTVKPFSNGQKVKSTVVNFKGVIHKECTCTTDNLHYEVLGEDLKLSIWHHGDLEVDND